MIHLGIRQGSAAHVAVHDTVAGMAVFRHAKP